MFLKFFAIAALILFGCSSFIFALSYLEGEADLTGIVFNLLFFVASIFLTLSVFGG